MISKTTKFTAILCSADRKQETEVAIYLKDQSLEILSTDHFERIGIWKLEEIELHVTAAENAYLEHRPSGSLLKMKTSEFKKISHAFESRLSILSKIANLPLWPYKVGYTVFVLGIAFGAYWALPRMLGRFVTFFLTPAQTQSMLSHYGIDKFGWETLETSESDNSENALSKMKSLLLKNGKLKENEFRLYLVQDDMVNAVSLPSGDVVLFCGFVNQSETSEEVMGVVAHELGHLYYQHAAKYLTGEFFESIWSKNSEMPSLGLFSQIRNLKFSRDQELEADHFALEWLKANGFSPKGLEGFFAKMQKKDPSQWAEILSTHPLSDKRIEEVKKYSQAQEKESISLAYLKQLKESCAQKEVSREKAQEPEEPDEDPLEDGLENIDDGSIPI